MPMNKEQEKTLYPLVSHGGRLIDSEELSDLMYAVMDLQPHKHMDYSYDDIGTAQLIADLLENKIKYCSHYRAWYIWDETRWKRQSDDSIISDKVQSIINILKLYCDEWEAQGKGEEVAGYKKYISSIRKNTAMKNIIEVLKTMVRVKPDEFDKDPYILNTPVSAFDLRTGRKVERNLNNAITMVTATNLSSLNKPCERWYTFIDEIMSHDKDKAAFLQRALGYSLLGTNREECMFVAYGASTRNGKGTLFYAIEKAVGSDYYGTASPDLICELGNGKRVDVNSPQPAVAKLVGKRFCVMSEADREHRVDTAIVKFYTGRDTVTTRGLYEAPFEFIPQFTMWLETNFLPCVTDDTLFRSDRVWVISFDESFTRENRDLDLKELFSAPESRPTVLKWLYDGCMDYMKNGLQVPECVKQATLEYQKKHDRIGSFIEKTCEVKPDGQVLRGTLYSKYRAWCSDIENRYKPMGSTSFYQELELRGYCITRKSDGFYVQGLELM